MFAERLKSSRKARKLSQAGLAALLGVSQQAVGKWEAGRATPDPVTVSAIADILQTSADALLGRKMPSSMADEIQIPVLGTVKAGYGSLAYQEYHGMEPANVQNPADYFYLIVKGDSMEPRIHNGDLALVHRQSDVDSGTLAVVLVNGEEGTLKRVIKKSGAVILQPFNQEYETQIFVGEELEQLTIVGKVVETKTKW